MLAVSPNGTFFQRCDPTAGPLADETHSNLPSCAVLVPSGAPNDPSGVLQAGLEVRSKLLSGPATRKGAGAPGLKWPPAAPRRREKRSDLSRRRGGVKATFAQSWESLSQTHRSPGAWRILPVVTARTKVWSRGSTLPPRSVRIFTTGATRRGVRSCGIRKQGRRFLPSAPYATYTRPGRQFR